MANREESVCLLILDRRKNFWKTVELTEHLMSVRRHPRDCVANVAVLAFQVEDFPNRLVVKNPIS